MIERLIDRVLLVRDARRAQNEVLSRDVGHPELVEGAGRPGEAGDEAEPTWRARFSLNVTPSGAVHADVALSAGKQTPGRQWRPERDHDDAPT